jgi:hypothetical protein
MGRSKGGIMGGAMGKEGVVGNEVGEGGHVEAGGGERR